MMKEMEDSKKQEETEEEEVSAGESKLHEEL